MKQKKERVVDVFINGRGEVCILFFDENSKLDVNFNASVRTMGNNDEEIGSVVNGIVTFPLEVVGGYPVLAARI